MKELYMGRLKDCMLLTVYSCMSPERQTYTKVSMGKILELLAKHHGIIVGRRWLDRCMEQLEESGYISRKRRFRHFSDGRIRSMSSMIALKMIGVGYLVKKRVMGAWALKKRMMDWFRGTDKRWPSKEVYIADSNKKIDEQEVRRLRLLAEMVFKPI